MQNDEERETNHIEGRKTDTKLRNGRSKFDAALVCLGPRVGNVTGDKRKSVAVNDGGAVQEADWSERNVVGRAPDTSLHLSTWLVLKLKLYIHINACDCYYII